VIFLPGLKNVKMIIAKDSVVTFRYEMLIVEENGTERVQVENSKPLTVLFGRGNLLEPFEARLFGLKDNDAFDFILKSEDTFGPHLEHAVQEFSKTEILEDSDFEDMELEVDMYLPMETEDGTPFNGKVVSLDGDRITLDFNHPLAGKDLIFRGKIDAVREATGEELAAGKHISGSNGKTCKQ
jgi:FKBP-type peptidyl-prolyl cis-trans isomerase SlyD